MLEIIRPISSVCMASWSGGPDDLDSMPVPSNTNAAISPSTRGLRKPCDHAGRRPSAVCTVVAFELSSNPSGPASVVVIFVDLVEQRARRTVPLAALGA